ncbi:hypothetical protein ACQJBY_034421 [Aegilops geniculata]
MRANLATERHAGKIYTRAMFEQFGHILYECGAYQMEEIDKGKNYVAIHIDAAWREKWCKTSYKVTVIEGGDEFDRECGQFAHMGLLCSHILKVMDFIRVTEIPKKHILKWWTRDASDILPAHLIQYQRDNAQENPFSFRHFNMYMQDMELVRMDDCSVAAYEHLISLFRHCTAEMKPFTEVRDGLGLEDRLADNIKVPLTPCAVTEGTHITIGDGDCNSANESGNVLATLLPPAKWKRLGRPTTSREKAPYEGLSMRTRFCGICRQQGHKRTTCPERGDVPKQPRKPARCMNCGIEGHRRNNCHKNAELRLN